MGSYGRFARVLSVLALTAASVAVSIAAAPVVSAASPTSCENEKRGTG